MKFEIWCEGYMLVEQHQRARCFGEADGSTFRDACDALVAASDPEMRRHYDSERLCYWGCRLFDNEADARKAFG